MIEFSDHAKRQLKRRRISQKIVLGVIRNSKAIVSSFRNRKLRRLPIDGKILQVVTVTEGSKIIVISGYYVNK